MNSSATGTSDRCKLDIDGSETKKEGEGDEDKTCSTLRTLLTKSSGNGGKLPDKFTNHERTSAGGNGSKGLHSSKTIDEVISCVIEQSLSQNDCGRKVTLNHYVPLMQRSPPSHNPQLMPMKRTLMETTVLYPDVPHAWLCDGRLLRLLDTANKRNFTLFQEQWRRGQVRQR